MASNQSFHFTVIKNSKTSSARVGEITTPHGSIQTPCFMPIATSGAIRCLTMKDLDSIGAEVLLSNTYHLYLRPGDKLIKQAGGLHKYINWNKPILTDSGGFQIFSLSKIRKITNQGVTFRSHLDGSSHLLTPETSIQIQQNLGSDIMMVLDECPPGDSNHQYASKSLDLTLNWASRCQKAKNHNWQALFGIVQGGTFKDLRLKSSEILQSMKFDGYAIGGLAVGESTEKMYEVLNYTAPSLPSDKPRYLMGVGTPENIIYAVKQGIDMFDCVLPTRNARHGYLFSSKGVIRLKREEYKDDFTRPDPNCLCYVCQNYSKSYLRHLYINKEPMSMYLNTLHNLQYYLSIFSNIRNDILNNQL